MGIARSRRLPENHRNVQDCAIDFRVRLIRRHGVRVLGIGSCAGAAKLGVLTEDTEALIGFE
jgi:hypothetical protein